MQTIVNLGTGGADLNGQNGSTTSADSNDALFLDWPGDNAGNYVYLPGVAGNYLSVPDEAALDITGDIDLRAHIQLDSWAATNRIITKGAASGNYSYYFQYLNSGLLRIGWSADGTTLTTRESTIAVTAPAQSVWVRATLDVDNGASGHTASFYTSSDGVTWTALGSNVVTAGATSIYAGSGSVSVADGDVAGARYAGKIHRAQVLNGIGGTTVLDVDCSQITSGSDTSFTAATGQTVTINRSTSGRKSVAVVSPVWLFGTDDKFTVAHNALLDVGASDDFTILAVVRQWNTPLSYRDVWNKGTTSPRIWLENYSTNNAYSFYVNDGVSSNLGENTGTYTPGAVTVIGGRIDRTTQLSQAFMDGTLSSGDDVSSYGSFANTQDMLVGYDVSGVDIEVLAVAVFRRTLTETEIAQLSTYYAARWS